ncbi:hypothetical protein AAFF_G00131500 [Aldrovandia affinis]|uniref:Uncharacterized protein n=1 Tax=Aldrovandia affinis TaxID=143900 RepID=A0AAD7RQV8_9TELE|nr:hypothetical protein AAFF_G00131500 [Aldrovandia affinis]
MKQNKEKWWLGTRLSEEAQAPGGSQSPSMHGVLRLTPSAVSALSRASCSPEDMPHRAAAPPQSKHRPRAFQRPGTPLLRRSKPGGILRSYF